VKHKQKTGFARQRDRNEPGIVAALRSVGASVEVLNGRGVPDLLVGFRLPDTSLSVIRLLEVKAPAGPRGGTSGRELTPDQRTWWSSWVGPSPVIVRSAAEAIASLGLHVRAPGLWTWCPIGIGVCDDKCGNVAGHLVGTYARPEGE
jgi:hypothetical protein